MRTVRVKRGSRGKRGFFASKRGDVNHKIILTLASLLIVAIVGLLLMERIGALANNTAFFRQYVAFDTGLLMTSIYASPSNLVYTYAPVQGLDLPFAITLTGSKVAVGILGERLRSRYYYMEDLSVVPARVAEASLSDVGVFYKSGQTLSTDVNDINILQRSCPRLWIDEPNWKKTKKIKMNVTMSDPSSDQSSSTKNFLDSVVKSVEKKHSLSLENKKPEIFIGLVEDSSSDDALKIYIDVNSKKLIESRTLACNILNELIASSKGLKSVQIMPISPEVLNSKDALRVINSDAEIKIVIEAGDFDKESSSAEIISDSIVNGLEAYFGYFTRESRTGFSYKETGLSYVSTTTQSQEIQESASSQKSLEEQTTEASQ